MAIKKEEDYTSEQDCLALTISVPTEVLGTGRELPVMVYVHGGGFTVGSSHVSALHGNFLQDRAVFW